MNRFQHLAAHALPAVLGLARSAASAPVFTAKLLALRAGFFLTRGLPFSVRDPRGFPIIIIELCTPEEISRVQEVLGAEWHGRPFSPCAVLFSREGLPMGC
jgi:hypothetical protein